MEDNMFRCPHCNELISVIAEFEEETIDPATLEEEARMEHESQEGYRKAHWEKKGWKGFKPRPFDREKFLNEINKKKEVI